jgi:hypothetical protein
MLLEFWFHLLFLWLAVILPFSTWRRRNAYRRNAPGQRLTSRRLYLRVMIGQWLAAGALVFVFRRIGIPLQALGLGLPLLAPTLWLFLAIAVALPIGLARSRRVLADPARRAALRARFGGVSLLAPTTDASSAGGMRFRSPRACARSCSTAAISGSISGRYLPMPYVAVLASVFFGLGHLYLGTATRAADVRRRAGILGPVPGRPGRSCPAWSSTR